MISFPQRVPGHPLPCAERQREGKPLGCPGLFVPSRPLWRSRLPHEDPTSITPLCSEAREQGAPTWESMGFRVYTSFASWFFCYSFSHLTDRAEHRLVLALTAPPLGGWKGLSLVYPGFSSRRWRALALKSAYRAVSPLCEHEPALASVRLNHSLGDTEHVASNCPEV